MAIQFDHTANGLVTITTTNAANPTSYTLRLPNGVGLDGQALRTDGAGNLSFGNIRLGTDTLNPYVANVTVSGGLDIIYSNAIDGNENQNVQLEHYTPPASVLGNLLDYTNTGGTVIQSVTMYKDGYGHITDVPVFTGVNLDNRFVKLTGPVGGQTVSGNVTFTGNVTILGNVTQVSANNLIISDNFIYLNDGNVDSNIDIGLVANYNDGTYAHTGIFRDASDGKWKVFEGYTPEPDAAVDLDTSHASYRLAKFEASELHLPTGNIYQGANITLVGGNKAIAIIASDTHTANVSNFSAIIASKNPYFDSANSVFTQSLTESNYAALIATNASRVYNPGTNMFGAIIGGQENTLDASDSVILGGARNKFGPAGVQQGAGFIASSRYTNLKNVGVSPITTGSNNWNQSSVTPLFNSVVSSNNVSIFSQFNNNTNNDNSAIHSSFSAIVASKNSNLTADTSILGSSVGSSLRAFGRATILASENSNVTVGGYQLAVIASYASNLGLPTANVATDDARFNNSAIVGGRYNFIKQNNSFIGGGNTNIIGDTINDTIDDDGQNAIIGGSQNRIYSSARNSGILGSQESNISFGLNSAIIGSYQSEIISSSINGIFASYQSNIRLSYESAIIAGRGNITQATDSSIISSFDSKIVGGFFNSIIGGNVNLIESQTASAFDVTGSAILGGDQNKITTIYTGGGLNSAIIAGKLGNITAAYNSVILGGYNNKIADLADQSIISGWGNRILSASTRSAILGGASNEIGTTAGTSAIISSDNSTILNNADASTIIGSQYSTIEKPDGVILGGWYSEVKQDSGIAIGPNTISDAKGKIAFSGTSYSAPAITNAGHIQKGLQSFTIATSGPSLLNRYVTSNNSGSTDGTNTIPFTRANTVYSIKGTVTAANAAGFVRVWEFTSIAKRGATANVSFVGNYGTANAIVNTIAADLDTSSWGFSLRILQHASTNTVGILCNGTTESVKWAATVETHELKYN